MINWKNKHKCEGNWLAAPLVGRRETRKQVVAYSRCWFMKGLMLRKPKRLGVTVHCPPNIWCTQWSVSLLVCLSFLLFSTLCIPEILNTATIANFLKSTFDYITPLTNLPWLTSFREWWLCLLRQDPVPKTASAISQSVIPLGYFLNFPDRSCCLYLSFL